MNQVLIDRLFANSIPEPNSGCWFWLGSSQPTGYGQMWNGQRPEQVHRIAYREMRGAIPAGCEVDHKCRCRPCWNPDHLEAVPHRINMRRSHTVMGENARKTHCKRGHELTGENLYINATSKTRQCRACLRLHAANKRARDRAT